MLPGAAYAGKKDRIEFSLTVLGKVIGVPRCEALKVALQKAAGDQLTGTSMVCVVEPGKLSVAAQKAVTGSLVGLQ